jgi:HK97 gp10 family phage protein
MSKTTFNTAEIEARIRAGAMAGVTSGAQLVHDEAVRTMMHDPKSGRHYPGNPNRSSAPGESPAKQKGRLIADIENRQDVPRLAVVVNAGAHYSAALEFGTEKMAPRPFMRPSLIKMRQQIEDAVREKIAEALR